MKKATSFLKMAAAPLLLPLLLTACQSAPKAVDAFSLTGSIEGAWADNANIRLNLVGVGFPNIASSTSNLPQRLEVINQAAGAKRWSYGVDLPYAQNLVGIYQVIAFDDQNGNAIHNFGEAFARNNYFLIFSAHDGTLGPWTWDKITIPQMSVKRGWNVYNAATPAASPVPLAQFKGYNLTK